MHEAYSEARELLQRAEDDATRIRAEADRYRRQREQEAELLVAKARRLLAVAEQTAASLSVVPTSPRVIDLDASSNGRPAPATAPARNGAREAGDIVIPTALDGMLRAAISRAFDKSYSMGS
ncbi:MAG: hypothetical protein ABL966_07000 [Acidimicrobiales bacterium]